MTRKYFGTDGIRGKVGESPITPEFVLRLGFAAGEVLARASGGHERRAVLIGKDTRVSGYMLEAALEAGFAAAGVDVMLCGPMPTPAVAYLTRALRLSAGIVISASHNPYPDNGIKFFSADGGKLADAVEQEIEAALERPLACRPSAELGKARRIDDAAGRYIEFCKSTFPNALDLKGLRIVVDCAHGAGYQVAPHVFHELGADVVRGRRRAERLQHQRPRGRDASGRARRGGERASRRCRHRARRRRRPAADGRCFGRDVRWRSALVRHRLRARARGTARAGVVGTLMTNLALERALGRLGVGFARAKVGDRYVLEVMQEKGWDLGGENSGHIICLDRHTTGDAIVAALQVLEARAPGGQAPRRACRRAAPVSRRSSSTCGSRGPSTGSATPASRRRAAEAEQRLGDRGRLLLRASGTEPVLRVMVEGEDEAEVGAVAADLAARVEHAAGTK